MSEKRDGGSLPERFSFKEKGVISIPFDESYAVEICNMIKRLGAKQTIPMFDEDGYVHRIRARFDEGVSVEVYGGIMAESVDVILRAQIETFENSEGIIKKLRRLMRRREILEKRGYHLRVANNVPYDSKPGFNEKGYYRLAYTKPLDTHERDRIESELNAMAGGLFLNFSEEDNEDPEADMW